MHSGGMPGVVTLINVFPSDRSATIVLANGDNRQLIPLITRKLGQLLYPDVPDLPVPQPGTSERAQTHSPAPSPALVGTWTGRLVHFDGDIPVRVTAKDTPIPYAAALEREVLPQVEDVLAGIKEVLAEVPA